MNSLAEENKKTRQQMVEKRCLRVFVVRGNKYIQEGKTEETLRIVEEQENATTRSLEKMLETLSRKQENTGCPKEPI